MADDLHFGRMPRIDTAERTLGYVDQLDFARVIARFGSVEEGIDRLVTCRSRPRIGSTAIPTSRITTTTSLPGDEQDAAYTEFTSRGRHK